MNKEKKIIKKCIKDVNNWSKWLLINVKFLCEF